MRFGAGGLPCALVLAALGMAACAAPSDSDPESVGQVRQRIVDGVPSTASQDATVMITKDEELVCTGTLIAPNLVLTARHCVSEVAVFAGCALAKSERDITTYRVAVGINATVAATVAKGKRLFVPADPSLCGADIALIELDKELKNNRRAQVRFSKLEVGEKTTAVGYGEDGSGAFTDGRYQRKGLKIVAVGPSTTEYTTKSGKTYQVRLPDGDVQTTESTCFGDSGGPIFDADGFVVGVTSRGIDEECVDRPTVLTGLPLHEEFIRYAVKKAGYDLDDMPENHSAESEEEEEQEAASESDKAPLASTGCAVLPETQAHSTSLGFAVAFVGAGAVLRRRRR